MNDGVSNLFEATMNPRPSPEQQVKTLLSVYDKDRLLSLLESVITATRGNSDEAQYWKEVRDRVLES